MFYEQRYRVFESELDQAVQNFGCKSIDEAIEFFKSRALITIFDSLNKEHPEQKLDTFSVQTKVTSQNLGDGINCKIIHTLILFPEAKPDIPEYLKPEIEINTNIFPNK